jgi:uncharacterized protein (TIGR03083 family)
VIRRSIRIRRNRCATSLWRRFPAAAERHLAAPLDLTPALKPERAELLALLRGLSHEQWDLPTECPEWNVKGIALHVLGDDLSLLTRQRDASTDSLTLFAERHPGLSFRALLDGFNEEWVRAARFISADLLVELLRIVGDWSDTFYREVGLESMSGEPVGLFAQTAPSPYWQVIAREYLERFVHQSQIRRAIDAPELSGPLVTNAARVVVELLASWLRDYAPANGSTVGIDYGAAGSWSWERSSDGWHVYDGIDDRAHARVRMDPNRIVALLSRGMTADEAERHVTTDGDPGLAVGLLDVALPLIGRPT